MKTVVQFGDLIALTGKPLKTPALAEDFSGIMDEEGVSLADLLKGLAEERLNSYKAQQRED